MASATPRLFFDPAEVDFGYPMHQRDAFLSFVNETQRDYTVVISVDYPGGHVVAERADEELHVPSYSRSPLLKVTNRPHFRSPHDALPAIKARCFDKADATAPPTVVVAYAKYKP